MHMCTDGKSGNAAAGTACVQGEACHDLAGPVGLYGWCHAEAAEGQQASQWGGCTPCSKLEAVKVYLLLDGVPVPRQRRGKDVEEDAFGRTFVSVREPRLYLLISEYVPCACPPPPGSCVFFAASCPCAPRTLLVAVGLPLRVGVRVRDSPPFSPWCGAVMQLDCGRHQLGR